MSIDDLQALGIPVQRKRSFPGVRGPTVYVWYVDSTGGLSRRDRRLLRESGFVYSPQGWGLGKGWFKW